MISDNFQFNIIWHRRNVVACVLCRMLLESDITFMPSVTRMDRLHWWYKHAACVTPPSSVLAFVTQMSEECKPKSPSAIQVENWQKTISIEKRLDIVNWLEKGEQIVDICHNVRYARCSVRTIRDNADRITESAKSETEVFM